MVSPFNWLSKVLNLIHLIQFRDKLRQSPELVQTYNDLKKRCENLDMIDYRIEKNKFISAVLNQQ